MRSIRTCSWTQDGTRFDNAARHFNAGDGHHKQLHALVDAAVAAKDSHDTAVKSLVNFVRLANDEAPSIDKHVDRVPKGTTLLSAQEQLELVGAKKDVATVLAFNNNNIPFNVASSAEFRTLFNLLNYGSPARTALTTMSHEVMGAVREGLAAVPLGVINMTTDMWSKASTNWLALTAHGITADWSMQEFLVGLVETDKRRRPVRAGAADARETPAQRHHALRGDGRQHRLGEAAGAHAVGRY